MKLIALALLVASSATAFAQPPSYPSHHHGSPVANKPVRNMSSLYFDALQRITLHDYEVWIAKDTSKTIAYRLHIKTDDGWHAVGQASGDIHIDDRIFGSANEAMIFLDYLKATRPGDIVDSYLEPIIRNMRWEHVATFDDIHEAIELLDLLMSVMGDEYVGQIIKIRVPPKALQ